MRAACTRFSLSTCVCVCVVQFINQPFCNNLRIINTFICKLFKFYVIFPSFNNCFFLNIPADHHGLSTIRGVSFKPVQTFNVYVKIKKNSVSSASSSTPSKTQCNTTEHFKLNACVCACK